VPNVTGAWRGKWPELLRIQIRKSHRGHAQQVAAALWGCHLANYAGKHLIVVDDDIDIHDWEAIEWALCYRVNAGLGDITTFPGTSGSMLDPSVPSEERDSVKYGHGKWTRVLIDATINWELEPQEQNGGNRYPPLGTGILHRISARIEKNSELMPLVRWQYQGLPDNQRKAFLFDNVTDPQGRSYDCSVAVGVLGASREIYKMALGL